jgi:hypothetical protein
MLKFVVSLFVWLGTFVRSRTGLYAGEFASPHRLAIDSKGNIFFVAETIDGRRVQKFEPVR